MGSLHKVLKAFSLACFWATWYMTIQIQAAIHIKINDDNAGHWRLASLVSRQLVLGQTLSLNIINHWNFLNWRSFPYSVCRLFNTYWHVYDNIFGYYMNVVKSQHVTCKFSEDPPNTIPYKENLPAILVLFPSTPMSMRSAVVSKIFLIAMACLHYQSTVCFI